MEVYFRCSLAAEIFLSVNPLLSSVVATDKIKGCSAKKKKQKYDNKERGCKGRRIGERMVLKRNSFLSANKKKCYFYTFLFLIID